MQIQVASHQVGHLLYREVVSHHGDHLLYREEIIQLGDHRLHQEVIIQLGAHRLHLDPQGLPSGSDQLLYGQPQPVVGSSSY